MTLRRYGVLFLVAVISAAGTYLAAYGLQRSAWPGSAEPRGRGVSRWLELTPQQADDVRGVETDFTADRAPLEAKLVAERERLATMLEDPATPNDEILQQVENVIAAQNALERNVADMLLAMRPYLSTEQQKRLFEPFASGVREGCGRHWRHGQRGDIERGQHGGGPRPGHGPGWGRGRGNGFQGRGRHNQQVTTAPTPESEGVSP